MLNYGANVTVKLTIMDALLEHGEDLLSKKDPYVTFNYDDQEYKSEVHTDGGKHPVWNYEVELTPNKPATSLIINVKHQSFLGSDEVMGFAVI